MEPIENRDIKVFFDTNIMEDYFKPNGEKTVICNNFLKGKKFCDLIRFVQTYDLKRFKIYIPEIVLMEMKHHFCRDYKNAIENYKNAVDTAKKMLGNSFKEKSSFVYKKEKSIRNYADKEIRKFRREYANWIEIPKHPDCIFRSLLSKAVSAEFPFVNTKGGGKDYSDAGFKDAILWESIMQEEKKGDSTIILFSNDHDFSSPPQETTNNRILVIGTYDLIIKKIGELYNLPKDSTLIPEIKTSTYFWESALNMAQIRGSFNLSSVVIDAIESDSSSDVSDSDEESQMYLIKASIPVDSETKRISITFDKGSNEIISSEIREEI